jgi:hypothetical protein
MLAVKYLHLYIKSICQYLSSLDNKGEKSGFVDIDLKHFWRTFQTCLACSSLKIYAVADV